MSIARQGIWLCPECGNHEPWKTRDQDTNQIDRKCSNCDKRARVTLNRSNSGKGRKRNYQIWERDSTIDFGKIIEEARKRNNKTLGDGVTRTKSEKATQEQLPPIWGLDWGPKNALLFIQKLPEEKARKELLRFVAERHDGYLELISEVWMSMQLPTQFNGDTYHQFTKQFCQEVSKSLDERIWKPELSIIEGEEVIPMRDTELYLKRRKKRLMRYQTMSQKSCLRFKC